MRGGAGARVMSDIVCADDKVAYDIPSPSGRILALTSPSEEGFHSSGAAGADRLDLNRTRRRGPAGQMAYQLIARMASYLGFVPLNEPLDRSMVGEMLNFK